LIQRLHFKPQQVQLQTAFSRTLPNHKTHVFNFQDCILKIHTIDNIRRIGIYLKEFVLAVVASSSRCRPKIVRF
jgi:hypothetical protein